jgi:integrase
MFVQPSKVVSEGAMQDYSIGRLKGSFVVTWKENGRRRRFRLRADSLGEAHSEARLLIVAAQSVSHEGPTVAQLWEAYLDEKAGRSVAESMAYTGKSILPWFGAFLPAQITPADCRAYIADRRSAGRQDGTIWSQLGHLRNVLSWAVKHGLIERAPYIERPPQPAPKDRWLSHEEVERLLEADSEPHIRLAILLMLTTAARLAAALELTWDRVDLDRGWLDLRTGEGLRKGRAVVPINATLHEALIAAKEAALSDFVIEWAGRPVRSIKRGFARTVQDAGLEGVTPHVLRHTAAVHMAAAGVSMSKIAQYLGHSSTEVTERVYARYAPDHLRDAAEVLNFGRIRLVR